jgi:hypothetical protein
MNQGRTGRFSFLTGICIRGQRNSNDMLLVLGKTLHCLELLYLQSCLELDAGGLNAWLWEIDAYWCSESEPYVGFYKVGRSCLKKGNFTPGNKQCGQEFMVYSPSPHHRHVTESALYAAYSPSPHQVD